MATPAYSRRDLAFQLHEVLHAEALARFPYFQDHDRGSIDLVLDTAGQFAETLLRPLLTELDRREPQLVDGTIRLHPGVRPIIQRFGEDGWISALFPYEEGGQQMPHVVYSAAVFAMQATNYSASVPPFLTLGAANLLRSFAAPALAAAFTPPMYAGQWQGTMALTEPDAGSSLSDITTSAEPTADGYYRMRGQKIYISSGDHDACDNVVHLMLAKIKGGPAGAKGISLFVVPRQRVAQGLPTGLETPADLVSNDVVTAGIYHKLGCKGAPIAHLMIGGADDCRGYLVGEPNKGLSYMFQMMNEARLAVGVSAAAIGTAAYHAALEYARARPQGRPIASRDVAQPQVPIIRHADVKRMLLFQKATMEGALGLLLQCSYYMDVAQVAEGAEKENAELLLDLLMPIAKTYPSEMGVLSTSAAIQVHGGAGYTTDFPVEQFFRESRIHPIHEGTTGIQGLDLLGRKITQHGGRAVGLLLAEMQAAGAAAGAHPELAGLAAQLAKAVGTWQQVTGHLLAVAARDHERFLADATLYLELAGLVVVAWQWLRQATVAQQALPAAHAADQDFYRGKLMAAQYFYEYELVKAPGLAKRLQSANAVTVDMQEAWF
ncbi:acyl-CoA dehydrogenase [Hymenobacter caeli]|uniref:Butyryl-CoA dehydrogenase n=1 Tax=Hymenobacter caeli TaxID=2735894 RepID=A0ABX2FQW0_9BACT|nr:acyl-CoA dehydrogenase [Hymenobacter caeli]NRT18827.1 butyryl-CoA dehydrogenase [Hymenobacter caeli]